MERPKEGCNFLHPATVCSVLIHVSCSANAGQTAIFIPQPWAVRDFFSFFSQHLPQKGYFKACILFKNIICNFVRPSRLYTRGLMALWCAISETRCPKWLEASLYTQHISMVSSKRNGHGSLCVWVKKKKSHCKCCPNDSQQGYPSFFHKGMGNKIFLALCGAHANTVGI